MRGELSRDDTYFHLPPSQRDNIASALATAIEFDPNTDPCEPVEQVTGLPHLAIATGLISLIHDQTFVRRADGHLGLNQADLAIEDYRNPSQRQMADLPLSQRTQIQELILQSVKNWPEENPTQLIASHTNLEPADIEREQKILLDERVIGGWKFHTRRMTTLSH